MNRICRQIQNRHASSDKKKSLAQRLFAKLRILFFYRKGGKLSLVSLYEQRFPRYRPIFKIAIFRHETWNVEKMPGVAYVSFLYPRMSKLSLFSLYWQRFMRYRLIFGVTPFGYGTRNLKKKKKKKNNARSCTLVLHPKGQNFRCGQRFPR